MKKRLIAILLTLALVICVLPVSAFADNYSKQIVRSSDVNKPAQALYFKDSQGENYYVWSGTIVSQGSSHTGYVLVIQEVLHRLYLYTGNGNFNPNGVDGIFGNGTRLAVVCFQNAYISRYIDGVWYDAGDGVVGPTTWWYIYNKWESPLGSPNLTNVIQ